MSVRVIAGVVVVAGRVEVPEVFKECNGEVKTVVTFEILGGVLVEMAEMAVSVRVIAGVVVVAGRVEVLEVFKEKAVENDGVVVEVMEVVKEEAVGVVVVNDSSSSEDTMITCPVCVCFSD